MNQNYPSDITIHTDATDLGDLFSLDSLCEMLSISAATGKNWVRLGKLAPQVLLNQAPYFTQEYIEQIREELKGEESTRLKSRRNKKYISGNDLYHSYVSEHSLAQISVRTIVNQIRNSSLVMDDRAMKTLLAECAIQLLLHNTIFPFTGSCLEGYLKKRISLNGREFLVDPLIEDGESALQMIRQYPQLFQVIYYYEEGEDTLGLLYISLKNFGTRKARGLYFTPAWVVRRMCQKIFEKNPELKGDILDPCCGTGNFLLQLPSGITFDRVYGIDTDFISVLIARTNLSLRFGIHGRRKLEEHIRQKDYLLSSDENEDQKRKYDLILGNPPWGYEFSEGEKKLLKQRYRCTSGSNIESYDVFLERALQDLTGDGVLSFVLPEAMLNVKAHTNVREILCETCRFQYLEYLGNVFDKVQCPCIIFQMQYRGDGAAFGAAFYGDVCLGMEVQEPERSYVIQTNRNMNPDCFTFLTNDEEFAVLEKIGDPRGRRMLKDQADFALGIVTGDNNRYISTVKTDANEIILRGSDIDPFRYRIPDQYLTFRPKEFQQVAAESLYRAPEKLLYRFICDRLIFAYDDRQTLSLNSCNILIPRLEGMQIKYILAVLNSRPAQFYFSKTFNSMKVLRSHLEQIPIPEVRPDIQEKIIHYVDELIELPPEEHFLPEEHSREQASAGQDEPSKWQQLYDRLDLEIAILYGLDYREYEVVKKAISPTKF